VEFGATGVNKYRFKRDSVFDCPCNDILRQPHYYYWVGVAQLV